MKHFLIAFVLLFCLCGFKEPITIDKAEVLPDGNFKYKFQHQGWGWRGSYITNKRFNVGDTVIIGVRIAPQSCGTVQNSQTTAQGEKAAQE